jgi:hypothetical protein
MSFFDHAINVKDLPVDDHQEQDFSPLPEGEYKVAVRKCEIKQGKNEGSEYLNIQLAVDEGKYAKRVIFGMITTKNASSTAENIGRTQFRTLMESTGVSSINSPEEVTKFVGGRVLVYVTQSEYNGKISNNVKSWKPVPSAMGSAPAPSATATGAKSPPWAK